MPQASRLGDLTGGFGKIIGGSKNVFINGKPAGLMLSQVTPHMPYGKPHPPHKAAKVVTGSKSVICNGRPLIRVGSRCTCGHKVIQGSFNVFVP